MLDLLRLPHILLVLCLAFATRTEAQAEPVAQFFGRQGSAHTNNWAVLVCASRYWFNYRHMANALGMYRTVKRLGIPDSNIILMLADDAACNPRNKFAGCVYANPGRGLDLYGDNIEVDYRGNEVTVENFLRVLTGRVEPSVPRSKRLLTDDRSNVFIFMTGHGGNEFLKFQDNEEISAFDIADAVAQMWEKKRYNELFFMIDTCQANTMYSKFYSPNVLATGSSVLGENSYSYENDYDIGVAVIDSYTHFILEFLEGVNKTSQTTMEDLFNIYDPVKIRSHPGVRSDLFRRSVRDALVTDFFGGVSQAEVLPPSRAPTLSQVLTELDPESAEGPAYATGDDGNATDLLISVGELDAGAFVAALGSGPQTEVGSSVVRKVRTWASSVGLLVLGGWVALRRK
ncbi:peptidase C13 family-domain-containing protein [Earliella scabrosa]|nr:peptidase C13 family-domain-containing protein [Earliella scabrosa]